MFNGRSLVFIVLGALAILARADDLPSPARCDLNASDWEQTLCLLAPVHPYGIVGERPKRLPAPWKKLFVGERMALPSAQHFGTYLRHAHISARDIGGDLGLPISQNAHGETARYLIIHDTSTLVGGSRKRTFPSSLNARPWSDLTLKSLAQKKNAHVFIGRNGQSTTAVDLGEALLTTKFEKTDRDRLEGLFVGVENLQPRLLDRQGIDSIAPSPGFTRAQMKRLAVVYVAASIRAGHWLIPAFHAVLDSGIADAHDDPQRFDLEKFSAALQAVLSEQAGSS